MPKQTLKQILDDLAHEQDDKIKELKNQIVSNETAQETTRLIEKLQARLVQFADKTEQFKSQLEELHSFGIRSQLEVVESVLSESYLLYLSYIQKVDTLHLEKAAFLNDHPEITPKVLEEFEDFEKNPLAAMGLLPNSYKTTLLNIHKERKQMYEPFFQLQRQIQKIEQEAQPTLQIILVQINENDFIWVVPIPFESESLPDSVEDSLDRVLNELLNGILKTARHKDWIFAGLEESSAPWLGYWTMTTLMEYSGTKPKAEHAQELLQELFKSVPLTVAVTEISEPVWRLGLQHTSEEIRPNVVELEDVPKSSKPLVEKTEGWYRDEDIISWERPLNISNTSNWNEQGRRLRTALVNMVMKGYIGNSFIPAIQLWRNLPMPHQEAMKDGVNILLENGVLVTPDNTLEVNQASVAVNSDKIYQIQNLINREVDDFWNPLLTGV